VAQPPLLLCPAGQGQFGRPERRLLFGEGCNFLRQAPMAIEDQPIQQKRGDSAHEQRNRDE
jgi:hypothetical protein